MEEYEGVSDFDIEASNVSDPERVGLPVPLTVAVMVIDVDFDSCCVSDFELERDPPDLVIEWAKEEE